MRTLISDVNLHILDALDQFADRGLRILNPQSTAAQCLYGISLLDKQAAHSLASMPFL